MYQLAINPGQVTLAQLRRASRETVKVSLSEGALEGIHASTALVQAMVDEGRTVYGINTGFGLLANTRIDAKDLQELQRSIVLSHAAGIGELMGDATVRLVMILKI
ncbi:MAG: aromatic amino acid lyase, partial [Gammaproteobacteria bacterium]|nr:aromatic amino acid lyase [Gammaproteobacteria bacterium]